MAHTGILGQGPGGAKLELHADPGETHTSLRVSAGAREEEPGAGVVMVHADGEPVVKLVATESALGRFEAWCRRSRGASGREQLVRMLHAGAAGVRDERWGFLRLAAVKASGDPGIIAQLEGAGDGHTRGTLLLNDAENADNRVEIGFDDEGPYVLLTQGQRSLRLSATRGVEWQNLAAPGVVVYPAERR
jgi:hypothetical protein